MNKSVTGGIGGEMAALGFIRRLFKRFKGCPLAVTPTSLNRDPPKHHRHHRHCGTVQLVGNGAQLRKVRGCLHHPFEGGSSNKLPGSRAAGLLSGAAEQARAHQLAREVARG